MKLDDNNLDKCRYLEAFIDNVVKSDEVITLDGLIKKFEFVVKKNNDVLEASKEALCGIIIVHLIINARNANKDATKSAQKASDAMAASLEGMGKMEEFKELSNRYIGRGMLLDEANAEIEKFKKKVERMRSKLPEDYQTEDEEEIEDEIKRKKEDEAGGSGSVFLKQLHIVNNLQQFSLKFDDYPALNQSVGTSDIANDEQLSTVAKIMEFKDNREFARAGLEFTISCGSRSTSDKDPYDGIMKIGGKTWRRKDFAQAIKASGITVRQFCAAFANMYWNFNLARGTPPENWRKNGFTEKTKFAAFDFFYAVGSNAAIPTESDGSVRLIRPPTNEENEANSSMRWASIYVQNASSVGHVTSSPLYNKGSAYEVKNKLTITDL